MLGQLRLSMLQTNTVIRESSWELPQRPSGEVQNLLFIQPMMLKGFKHTDTETIKGRETILIAWRIAVIVLTSKGSKLGKPKESYSRTMVCDLQVAMALFSLEMMQICLIRTGSGLFVSYAA